MPRRSHVLLIASIAILFLPARADERAEAIAQIHIAAIGGQERIDQVAAYHAKGHVTTDGQTIAFTMTAARPDRVRMEFTYADGNLIQATDGVNPPWEVDTRLHPPANRLMGQAAAEQFLDGAEFDDPLVAGKKRGYIVEFAGETTVDGHQYLRLLVTHHLERSFFLLLDPETYYIVLRIDPKPAAGPEHTEVVTEYRDYRPVDGVLVAYGVTVRENGRVTEDAMLDSIHANPVLSADSFARPKP